MKTENPLETLTKATWHLDAAHSSISFNARHMIVSKVKGTFDEFQASYATSDGELEDLQAEAVIKASSINTGQANRDAHLKSDDFFNAEKFPEIRFKSKGLEKISNEKFKLRGDLTIRDKTHPIELDVNYGGVIKDPYGNDRAGFEVKGTVNRFDYDLKWNQLLESGGAVVGKDIQFTADLEFIKEK